MERISNFGDGRDREVGTELWNALSPLLQMMFGGYADYALLEPLFLSGVSKSPDSFNLDLMAPNLEHSRKCGELFKEPLEIVFSMAFKKDCQVRFWSPDSACIFDRALDILWEEDLQQHPSVGIAREAMWGWLKDLENHSG